MIFTSDRQEAKRLAAQIRGSYSAGPNEHGMFEVFDGDTNTKTAAGHIIEHAMREALDRAQGAEAREEGLRDALAERINRIVALELERDSALARVEALEAALGRIKGRAEAQPVHVCGVADFDLQVIAREASQALHPPPPAQRDQ